MRRLRNLSFLGLCAVLLLVHPVKGSSECAAGIWGNGDTAENAQYSCEISGPYCDDWCYATNYVDERCELWTCGGELLFCGEGEANGDIYTASGSCDCVPCDLL
ncbi:MAG: hypothetical protein A3H96_21400 [Acidobacteria bacterium RIFCSPLOWO2_02_FULL_67_36]|nr:MAG: hypothetical protein A3H96_21400 [Acidobacteria bacterium RIFCSPLOWO2_02_FULL_67_36]OFW21150.1 MAG: hypothetical protein A3G21_10990 [Acidobacteria bacterium RIFCSPLOWO2_12_FULL_66_21]